MRREIYRMDRERAIALLQRAPIVHLAAVGEAGQPILRTVHGVIVKGAICFHAAPAGEKMEALGREVVVSAEEIVAEIPSWFVDPERACPATTYYESAQVHGALEPVEAPEEKARVLQALMAKFQPEGRHVPITADDPLYRAAVRGLLIARVSLERLDGKSKLGQNRTPEELARILALLWQRGRPGDDVAIERVRAANPAVPTAPFLRGPPGARLHSALAPDAPDRASEAARLLAGAYWNEGVPLEAIAQVQRASTAWVGATDGSGRLIATARAVSDGVKQAFIFDVMVDPAERGRGLALALLRLLLDHPSVRQAKVVRLGTKDAQPLYRRLGFVEHGTGPHGHPEMILRRPIA